jgi:flagellar motility protein MotE (MotC chaperone)
MEGPQLRVPRPPFAQPPAARAPMRRPRILPATIAAMAVLLLLKSVSFVQAATADAAEPTTVAVAKPDKAPAAAAAPVVPPPAPALVAPAAMPTVSDAERGLLLDLRHRRDELDARSRELDARNAVLSATASKLDQKVAELAALQARLDSLESSRQSHETANWTGLVKTYETMKPRDAATIFDALDMQVLLQVLDRMSNRKAAPILAAMMPDRARLATQLLAEMRTRATTPPPEAAPLPRPSKS